MTSGRSTTSTRQRGSQFTVSNVRTTLQYNCSYIRDSGDCRLCRATLDTLVETLWRRDDWVGELAEDCANSFFSQSKNAKHFRLKFSVMKEHLFKHLHWRYLQASLEAFDKLSPVNCHQRINATDHH